MKRLISLVALLLAVVMLFSGCTSSLYAVIIDVLDDEPLPEKRRAPDASVHTEAVEEGLQDRLNSLLADATAEEEFSEETLQELRKKLELDNAEGEESAAQTEGSSRLARVHFDEMPCESPDVDAFAEAVDAVEELLNDRADAELVAEYVTLCNEAYDSFGTGYHIANIRYSMDVTDDAAAAMYDEYLLASVEIDRLYGEMYDLCAYSDVRDELEALCFEEGELQAYASEESDWTDEDYDRYYELYAEEMSLISEYRSICADFTVTVDGVTYDYYEAINDPYIDWELYDAILDGYYEKYNPMLGEIYIELVSVRNQIAELLGYNNYEEYAFECVYGRDYSPEEAAGLVADIQTYIAPVYEKAIDGEAWYWLWDPEATEEELGELADWFTAELGGSIEETWELLNTYGLCDYRISHKKEWTSYQVYLYDYALPFAFICPEGYRRDIMTIVHELGHAVDANVNEDATLSIDLAELFSQALEYLFICRADDADLLAYKMLDTLDTYAQQGSYHEFERQVYALSEDELTLERINEISLQTAIDFGYFEEGEEAYYLQNWIDISHFFDMPFYVISYCVSNDAAFQIFELEAEAEGSGFAQYERLLPRDHDALLETLDVQSDLASPFTEGRMEETAEILDAYLEEYLGNLW